MSFLEKIGLARKSHGFTPIISDGKGKKPRFFNLKHGLFYKALIVLCFLAFVVILFPRTSFKEVNYKVGDLWRQEDLVAPFTFSLLKNKSELEKEKQDIRNSTLPIYHLEYKIRVQVQSSLDSLNNNMKAVLELYRQWKLAKPNTEAASNDSLGFVKAKQSFNIGLSDAQWKLLENSYVNSKLSRRSKRTVFIGDQIYEKLNRVITRTLDNGIVNVDKSSLTNNEITVRDVKNRTQSNYYVNNVRDLKEAREYARYQLSNTLTADQAAIASQLFDDVIQPNLIYNKEETNNRINEKLASLSPTEGAVVKGQVIIRKGDIITKPDLLALESLARAKSERASKLEVWQQYIGEVFVIVAIVLIFFMYIYLYRKPIFDNNGMFLLVYLAMTLAIGGIAFVNNFENISPYIVPIAIAPIILTIIFDSRVGLLTTISLALLAGMMIGKDFEFTVATITACSMGVYSVRDIKNRSQFFFFTPALVLISYLVVFSGFSLSKLGNLQVFESHSISVLINGVLIWLTYPLILLFEKLFKVTTDVSLLELSDTNQPLLKALMMRAPGTFHHSLQVANLAEAAAAVIGANSILCRVGALYHDIGKMEKPEYFVENQSGVNEHNKLKPRMSAIVIKAHVTNGIKMAEEEGLPEDVTQFIKTHHGTSVIRYFYEKAKENTENPGEIEVKDFQYDGPLPNTKETGIVMLADGVEASSRSMSDPNYQKLENLVGRIFDERLDEGQLNDCPLTFKDLKQIKNTFLNILVGMYHGRVKYPGQDEAKPADGKSTDSVKSINVNDVPSKKAQIKDK